MGQHGVQTHGHKNEILTGGADRSQIAHTGGILKHRHYTGDAALFRDLDQHIGAAAAALRQRFLQRVQHNSQRTIGGKIRLGGFTGQRVGGARGLGFGLRLGFRFRFRSRRRFRLLYNRTGRRNFFGLVSAGSQTKYHGQCHQQSDPLFHLITS